MNETVLQRPIGMAAPRAAVVVPRKRSGSTARSYLLLALFIVAGYLLRTQQFINPEEGVGYWLGIVGGVMMLSLLIYPLRKRIRLLHVLGPTKHWFQIHMVFGLVGPLLILYHCNFTIGSINSRVALYCMLLVAGSGIIGKHFYARIHRGLYGQKTSLKELQQELSESVTQSRGLAKLMPTVVEKMTKMSDEMQGCRITETLGVRRSLRWTFTHWFTQVYLLLLARRELRAAAAGSPRVAADYRKLLRSASRYIRNYVNLVGRVAQFSFYERLFALWHVLHLPIFFMMIISAVFHVLAVHMY